MNKVYNFVSKNSNLMIVLRPGVKAEPLLGLPGKEPLHLKFQDGKLRIEDENVATQLIESAPYKRGSFILVDEQEIDPYKYRRKENEPGHNVSELKYGTVVGTNLKDNKVKLKPEVLEAIEKQQKLKFNELLNGLKEQIKSGDLSAITGEKTTSNVTPKEENSGAEQNDTPISIESVDKMKIGEMRKVAKSFGIKVPFGVKKDVLAETIKSKIK